MDEKYVLNLQTLFSNLSNPNEIKNATTQLENMEKTAQFGVYCLYLTNEQHIQVANANIISLQAAIYFKNFIMKHWSVDEDDVNPEYGNISINDRNILKENILSSMLSSSNKKITSQLEQALAIMSSNDFPRKWSQLLPKLIENINLFLTNNIDISKLFSVLNTLHSILYHYRYKTKSQELWEEIAYVLEHLSLPLQKLYFYILKIINNEEKQGNIDNLTKLCNICKLCLEIYHSLISQEFPQFLDHRNQWFESFKLLLNYIPNSNNINSLNILRPNKGDSSGPLDELQSVILEILTLGANKYEEDFKEVIPSFVEQVWNTLTFLSDEERFDILVSKAIKFLTSIVKKPWYKHLFESKESLEALCTKVVVPQIKLREQDVELFKWNGLEYVRRDMEGSDVDTRRRTTINLVRGLCLYFNDQISSVLLSIVSQLHQQYINSNYKLWQIKDAAMYLIYALAIEGQTAKKGVTSVNKHINLLDFFQQHIITELSRNNTHEIIIFDCLKFINTFRSQLPINSFEMIYKLIIPFLTREEYVIHTYACAALEKLLSCMKLQQQGADNNNQIRTLLTSNFLMIFQNLFNLLKISESNENVYIMKLMMRIMSFFPSYGHLIKDYIISIINELTILLSRIALNPKNPKFNDSIYLKLFLVLFYV